MAEGCDNGSWRASHRRARGQAGAALVELLVVVAVLGVLGAIVVLWPARSIDDADARACSEELSVVRSAVHAANLGDPERRASDSPANHLEGGTRWYGWSGAPGEWSISAVAPIPFGC